MGKILKFPAPTKLGLKRVRTGPRKKGKHPDEQLSLFDGKPDVVELPLVEVSTFERALILDEEGDPKAVELYHQAVQ